jgi:predicted nicotinamide N-methyase
VGERSFRFGSVRLRVLSALDLDELITDDWDPDRLPFWSVVWESAPLLCWWMAARGGWEGVPVLELGCGVGLAGLAASALGARVTQTDLFPEAVNLARLNAERNRIAGIRRLAADWRAWPLRDRWPVILGADLVYERACHGPLLDVLDQALAPGGSVYLADPGRTVSQDFLSRAKAAAWTVEILESAGRSPATGGRFVCSLRRADALVAIPSEVRSPLHRGQ